MNYAELIKDNKLLLAHKTNSVKESLLEHMDNTLSIFNILEKKHNIINKLSKSLNRLTFGYKGNTVNLSDSSIQLISNMFKYAIPLHDIGKINPKFQIDKMDNNIKDFMNINEYMALSNKLSDMNTYHSELSGLIYIDVFSREILKIKRVKERNILYYIMLIFSNVIMSHHTILENLENRLSIDNIDKLIYRLESSDYKYLTFYNNQFNLNKDICRVLDGINKYDFDTEVIYIWSKILYSLITSCDFIATYSFYKEVPVQSFNIKAIQDIDKLKGMFNNNDISKGIEAYSKDDNYFNNNNLPKINNLRSEILLECKSNIHLHKDSHIFNIESPTGSGKTFNSISCALELLNDKSKLIYVFPINTIASQTKKVLSNIFKDTLEVQEINSISKLPININDENIDFNKILLDYQLFNYEGIITSNVALFNLLFGCDRSSSMGLISLFDSVIILDEIQNYKNSIWKEIIEMLYRYSDIMGFKIIIMSATLPNLEELIGFDNKRFINLVSNPNKYYSNSLFKDRVVVDGSLLNKKIEFEDLKELIISEVNKRNSIENGKSKFIIEFISKNTAVDFYEYILSCNLNDFNIYELDGDDNIFNKQSIIDKVQSKDLDKNILLITTQVIEAGVDIDFDLGAKDAVFPDTDEQFLGRINRSCTKNNCKAFFFNLDNESGIYKGDYRIGTNISNNIYLNVLKSKNFEIMYKKVFNNIEQIKNKSLSSDIKVFKNTDLKYLRYENIYKHMQLITTKTFEIYIPGVINEIDGFALWEEFKGIINNKDLSYAKKNVLLKNLKENMSYFTYSIYGAGVLNIEPVGGLYYIEDTNGLIRNNKLNTKILKENYIILR